MDLTILSKDSKMAPSLVRLYDSHKLYTLAKDKKPLARTELSNAICELLDLQTSDREAELIADVLIGLIRQAEKDLKEALSERLAVMDNVPLRVALNLANDEIDVARPVLIKSRVLGDLDLIYIIKSKDSAYWEAIAQREAMSDQVITVLAETKDNKTVHRLLENNNIILPKPAMDSIGQMAETSETIAKPLMMRKEIDSALVTKIYQIASQELKSFISKHHSVDAHALNGAVDDIVIEFEEVMASEFTPTNSMLKTAERQKEKGLLNLPAMISTLRRSQIQTFIAQFAVYSGVSAKQVEHALRDDSGKVFALICKALDIVKQDFVTIFLLTNRMRDTSQMVDMNVVSKAVGYYNRMERAKARSILKLK